MRSGWLIGALILMVAPIVAFWPILFSEQRLGPYDTTSAWVGQTQTVSPPWDVLQADSLLQFVGWRDLVFSSWREGHVPFWNPYVLGGTDLLANSQSGALYPPHIGLALLGVPATDALGILAWFHLAVAGLGLFALVRTLGGSYAGAIVAGTSVALSTFFVGWAGLGSVPATCAWIPWILAGLTLILDPDRHLAFPAVGTALATAMMIAAGHLQFAAYGLLGAGIWALVTPREGWRRLPVATLALVTGLALAAPHLLPVLDAGSRSHRRAPASVEGFAAYSASAIGLTEAAARLGNGIALGDPSRPLGPVPTAQYLPAITRPGANFAEGAITVGPLVLALLFLLRRQPGLWRPVAVGGLGLALALGTPIGALLYFGFPGWSATGSPGRAGVLIVMMLAVLAGLALPEERPARSRLGLALVGSLALTLLGATIAATWPAPPGFPPGAWPSREIAVQAALTGFGAWIAAAVVILLLGRPEKLVLPIGAGAALVVAAVQGAPRWAPMDDPRRLTESLAALEPATPGARVAVLNDRWSLFTRPEAILPPNLLVLSGVRQLGGYDSLIDRETVAMLRAANGRDPAPPENGNLMFVWPTAAPEALAAAGVTEIWIRDTAEAPPGGRPVGPGVRAYSLPGPGRVSGEGGSPVIVRERPGFIEIDPRGATSMIARERFLPGWRATGSDGSIPIVAEGPWMKLSGLRGGEVTLTYEPPRWRTALLLSAVGLVSLLAFPASALVAGRFAGKGIRPKSKSMSDSPK